MKQNLSYTEIICLFEAIKNEYTKFLSPFFDTYKVRTFKAYIYSLPISKLKKDILWCYLNDDIDIGKFFNSLN